MEVRKWYPGYKGETKFGKFIVLRKTDSGYLVQYISGDWKDKFINMPKQPGKKTYQMESLKLTLDQKEKIIDLFYEEFPEEFESVYPGENATYTQMIRILRDTYPPYFQLILSKFFSEQK